MSELPAGETPGSGTGLGLFASAATLLLLVAYSPALASPLWLPKYAVMLVIAGVGGVTLLQAPPPHLRRATWAARAFIGLAAISALLSSNPDLSTTGSWNQGTGLVLLLAAGGSWAIGVRLRGGDIRLLTRAVILGCAANAGVACLQMAFDLSSIELGRFLGRATGLQQSPIFLGPVLVAGLSLLLEPLSRRRWWAGWALLLSAMGVALADSRGALLLIPPVLAWGLHRFGIRPILGAGLILILGVASATVVDRPPEASPNPLSQPIEESEAPVEESEAPVEHTNQESRPLSPRFATWRSSHQALLDRPLFGAGPGSFREATIAYRPEIVARDTPDRYFTDAHNFVVEHLVTTGLAGTAALLLWLTLAARRSQGVFGVFAAVLGVAHLFQPENPVMTPVAFLALGAAATRSRVEPETKRSWIAARYLGGGACAALGILVVLGGWHLQQARLDFNPRQAARAERELRPWPTASTTHGLIHQYRYATGILAAQEPARAALRRAAARDPFNPLHWLLLAEVATSHGRLDEAQRALARARALDPYSPRADAAESRLNRRRESGGGQFTNGMQGR